MSTVHIKAYMQRVETVRKYGYKTIYDAVHSFLDQGKNKKEISEIIGLGVGSVTYYERLKEAPGTFARITEKQAVEIFDSNEKNTVLAKRYCVTDAYICKIKAGTKQRNALLKYGRIKKDHSRKSIGRPLKLKEKLQKYSVINAQKNSALKVNFSDHALHVGQLMQEQPKRNDTAFTFKEKYVGTKKPFKRKQATNEPHPR